MVLQSERKTPGRERSRLLGKIVMVHHAHLSTSALLHIFHYLQMKKIRSFLRKLLRKKKFILQTLKFFFNRGNPLENLEKISQIGEPANIHSMLPHQIHPVIPSREGIITRSPLPKALREVPTKRFGRLGWTF